jgi:hypothetical protein
MNYHSEQQNNEKEISKTGQILGVAIISLAIILRVVVEIINLI